MSLILRIESGPDEGKTLPLEQGQAVRVGRGTRADYSVACDPFLSSLHFELLFNGRTCTLLDLNSTNGTTVCGTRIQQVELAAGDRFTAGQTEFTLASGASSTAAREPAEPEAPFDATMKERLLKEMRTNLQPLYAVLDAAHSSNVLALLAQYKCEYVSLFHTDLTPELVRFAPYLVALPPDSAALAPLVELGWGKDWGIYLTGAGVGSELIGFLRKLLISTQPDGQQAILRFYDPRVLRTLLSNATSQQLPCFFGPVRSYVIAGEKPNLAVGFAVSERGLERYDIPLAGEKAVDRTVVSAPAWTGSTSQGPLLLSNQQAAEAKAGERDAFADELLCEVQMKFVERCASLGEAQARHWIEFGCTRAQRYGIQTRPGIRDYVFLMMQLGRKFDEDPKYPWASDLLHRRLAPPEKLARLKEIGGKLNSEHLPEE